MTKALKRVAALDLGSNTFLCLIAEGDGHGIQKIVHDEARVVRLGQGLSLAKKFHPDALSRARACLVDFTQIISKNKIEKVVAVATSAARDASNYQELLDIGRDLGIQIEIIEGKKEAELTFLGALSGSAAEKSKAHDFASLIVDIGGGSTEYILGQNGKIVFAKSIDIGCVRLTESMVTRQPIDKNERAQITKLISDQLELNLSSLKDHNLDEILAVAGTPTAIAAIELGKFDEAKVEGFIITEKILSDWVEKFVNSSVDDKVAKYKLERGRADVILVGSLILKETIRFFGKSQLTVSTRGVRYGALLTALKLSFVFAFSLFNILFLNKNTSFAGAGERTVSAKIETIREVEVDIKFKKKHILIDKFKIEVEIAETEQERMRGLMLRRILSPDSGMLFIFPEERIRSFWMKDTFIDLSIAFFDKNGVLSDIQEMEASKSVLVNRPSTYVSGSPAKYALEMNKGWFLKNKIHLGARLSIR